MKTNFKLLAAALVAAALCACGAGSNEDTNPGSNAANNPSDMAQTAPAQAPVSSTTAPVVAVYDTHTPAGTLPPDLPPPPPSMAPPCPPEVCFQKPYNELEHPAFPRVSVTGEVLVGELHGASADERQYPDLSNLSTSAAQ